jgi:hypothetical protein
MSERALLVFLKYPRAGSVKTRLLPALDGADVAGIARALAEGVLEDTVPHPGEYERLVFFDPPEAAGDMRAWLPGVRLAPQADGDLGERMEAAFARAFRRGARRVALIGTDTPALTRETVLSALNALETADVAIGPAEDGGYYLIALRRSHPELFAGVAWGGSTVLAETLARAASAGLSVSTLEKLRDLDTFEDLRAEWPRLRSRLDPGLRERAERALRLA